MYTRPNARDDKSDIFNSKTIRLFAAKMFELWKVVVSRSLLHEFEWYGVIQSVVECQEKFFFWLFLVIAAE